MSEAPKAPKTAGQAAAQAPLPGAAKPKSASAASPREYVVYRELDVGHTVNLLEAGGLERTDKLLVELGSTEAKTAKEARRTVAKAELAEADLRTDQGVALRAITKTAATAGRGIARLKVEPTWAD